MPESIPSDRIEHFTEGLIKKKKRSQKSDLVPPDRDRAHPDGVAPRARRADGPSPSEPKPWGIPPPRPLLDKSLRSPPPPTS